MSYPALSDQCALLGRVEAVPGTAETSLSLTTDQIQLLGASEPEIFWLAPNSLDEILTGSLDKDADAPPACRCARFKVKWAVQGAGSANAYVSEASKTLPEGHVFYRVNGYSLNVATNIATYTLDADPSTTGTFQLEISGKKYIIQGAVMQDMQLTLNNGQFGYFEGTVVGVMPTDPVEQAIESPTYAKIQKAIFVGASSFVVGSYSPKVDSAVISWNGSADPNTNANAADGVEFFKITGRKVETTVTARIPSIATWDPNTDWKNRTVRALAIICGVNQGTYKRLKVNASNTTYTDVQDRASGKFRSYVAKLKHGAHATAVCNLVWD